MHIGHYILNLHSEIGLAEKRDKDIYFKGKSATIGRYVGDQPEKTMRSKSAELSCIRTAIASCCMCVCYLLGCRKGGGGEGKGQRSYIR